MMVQQRSWTVWIDRPYSLERGQRGVAPIEEAIEQVYGVKVSYEAWMWDYHKISLGALSRSRAESIGMTLLALHLQRIREDTRQPWNGECRFELTCDNERPEWVLAYDREREKRLSKDADASGGGQ
jgi:hypothetical protein